jgi:hypothetical protein
VKIEWRGSLVAFRFKGYRAFSKTITKEPGIDFTLYNGENRHEYQSCGKANPIALFRGNGRINMVA